MARSAAARAGRSADAESPATAKYERRRADFINAASRIMNERGLRGMTLADVAGVLGMTTPSVRHYFKKKEELAAACILLAIDRVNVVLTEAGAALTAPERLRAFVRGYFAMLARIDRGEEPPLATFSEVRTLEAQSVEPITNAYGGMVRKLRRLMQGPELEGLARPALQARLMYVFIAVTWAPVWVRRYDVEDYALLADTLSDIILNGLCSDPSRAWRPEPLPPLADPLPPPDVRPISHDTYLNAATRLINEQGYRGASVDAIAARLKMTKGAVYHHHAAKGDLVAACFDRSYRVIWRAQRFGLDLEADGWMRLCAVCAAVARFQVSPEGPLLTNSALSALPMEEASRLRDDWSRTCDRFAMIVSLGIRDGSIRPVDASVAAQFIYAGLNAVNRLPYWQPGIEPEAGVDLVLQPMLRGLFSR